MVDRRDPRKIRRKRGSRTETRTRGTDFGN